ncbi:MAG: hypothetical protein JST12_17380 [Armatimonadetes bacterium]|nr:hypothetical protein [Armatimonadota bacterium]
MTASLFCFAALMSFQTQSPKLGDADFPKPTPNPRHDAKVADVRSHNYDLMMIGDSITQTMGDEGGEWEPLKQVWATHFAPRNAINLGYSGYRTENVLWNLQNGELDCDKSPKVAVLLIGTNNTDDTNYPTVHTAAQIFAGTKAIVETIRKKHPTTKILILRIFPRGGANEVTNYHRRYKNSEQCVKTCEEAGLMTKKLADGKHVFWLDVNSVFFRKDGSMNTDLIPDLVHPNAEGAEAWANALEPTLSKLMDDKPIKSQHQLAFESAPKPIQMLAEKRVMILGDSITQDGRYVGFLEYMLEKQYPWLNFNLFSVGLASETASGLTEASHPFPRPDIHERLARALKAVRPDVVFACYGMNDGIYQPFDKGRFEAFQHGITSMIQECQKAGAKVILVTPPSFDIAQFGENVSRDGVDAGSSKPYVKYNDVLAQFAAWEVKARPAGVQVIDIFTPLNRRATSANPLGYDLHNPGDGIHPTSVGHLLMARFILQGLGLEVSTDYPPDELSEVEADPLYKLVDQHRRTRSDGWLPFIGYTRGESFKTDNIVSVEDKARDLQSQVDALRRKG